MKTFQKPLNAQEEKLFLQKYQEGDPDARDVLIERNLRLVAHMAKKYQGLDEDPEDLISIGTIGLIKAVMTFNHATRYLRVPMPPDVLIKRPYFHGSI